jgi:hypothetical protein
MNLVPLRENLAAGFYPACPHTLHTLTSGTRFYSAKFKQHMGTIYEQSYFEPPSPSPPSLPSGDGREEVNHTISNTSCLAARVRSDQLYYLLGINVIKYGYLVHLRIRLNVASNLSLF